jgi:hypothetical protein
MMTDQARVIVTVGPCECHSVQTTQVHHRDFPEIHSEGEDRAAAGTNLANQLARTLDSAPSGYRRQALERAIADVRDFLNENSGTGHD